MSYRPPSSSKWAAAEPFRKNKSEKDVDGWQTVPSRGGSTTATATATAATKWGGSALKKPAPKFEDEFPSLVGPNVHKPVGGAGVAEATAAAAATAPMTMAERMKLRLAEEEAERLRKAEEERMKAEQDEKSRYLEGDVIPLTSFLHSRMARNFKTDDYHDPEIDDEYYSQYPEHYHEERAASYDYEEDAEYGYDDDDTYNHGCNGRN